MNLTTATPAEIDAEWAPIAARTSELMIAILNGQSAIQKANDDPRYYGRLEFSQIQREAERVEAKMSQWHEDWEASRAAEEPYKAEWTRRGGWTRAYLVVTSGVGHVHRSTECSTCFPTTQFNWLVELSGASEQEIVDQAGERACTVCYASAPVALRLDRPTTLFSEDEKRRQAERAERETKRNEKAAQAVVDESGAVLFKTERAATNAIASELDSMVHYGPTHPSFESWKNSVEQIVAVLKLRGVEYDVEAKLDQVRAKKRREHAKFMKTPQAAMWRAQGVLDPKVDEPGYDAAKY